MCHTLAVWMTCCMCWGSDMNVTNKLLMYEMLERGAFGNHLQIFRTEGELLSSGFSGPVGVRCVGKPGSPFYFHRTVANAVVIVRELRSKGIDAVFQESVLPNHITIQGEVCYVDGLLCLTYSTAKTHMREALKTAKTVTGFKARSILNTYADPSSMDDIDLILETYKDHVIEFTAFSTCVGCLKGRTVCIWEVRLY